MPTNHKYILLTAARNEEGFIENTIKSVIAQTLLPLKWIIVSDQSTDNTDNIVSKYAEDSSFLELLRIDGSKKRNFASKVFAIQTAYEKIKDLDFDFIGILDADITMSEDYYEKIISKFVKNEKLGLAGGGFININEGKEFKMPYHPYSVRGAVQLFRRKCYEEIGGLIPLRWGGEDGIACVAVRMKGWDVQTFEDLIVYHHRTTGSVGTNYVTKRIRDGKVEYSLGYIPSFQFIKAFKRWREKPVIFGIFFRLAGYWMLKLKREKLGIPKDLYEYFKTEQKTRMMESLKSF